jgi:general secretion pathway protein H
MTDKHSDSGFSLAEILVVLAIISLVGLVGFDGFIRQKNAERLRSVTQKIEQLAVLTALHAVTTGATQAIIIDVANGTVTDDGGTTTIQVPASLKLSALTGAELVRQNKTASINFYSDGTSSGGNVAVEDQRGSTGTVTILWLTGVIDMTVKDAP